MAIQAITMLNIKERERVDPLFQNDLWVVGRGVNNAAISNVNLAFSLEIFLVESTFFLFIYSDTIISTTCIESSHFEL